MLIVSLRMAAVHADMHTQARTGSGASRNAPLLSTDSHSSESSLRTSQPLKPRSGRDEWVQTRVREVLEAKVVRVRETLAVHDLSQSEHVAEPLHQRAAGSLRKTRTSTTQHEGRALATIDGLLTIFEKHIRALDTALVTNADRDTRAIAEGLRTMLSLARKEMMRGSSSETAELEDVILAGQRLTQQVEVDKTLSSRRRFSPSRPPQPPLPHPPSEQLFMASPPPPTTPPPPRWHKGTAAGLKSGQSPRIFQTQADIAPMPQQEHRDRVELLKQLTERLQGLVTYLNLELCDNVTFESKQQFERQLAALQDQIATLQAEDAGQPTSEDELPLRLQRRSSRQLAALAGNLACLLSDLDVDILVQRLSYQIRKSPVIKWRL